MAAEADLHPSILSEILNEHRQLTPELAGRISTAMDSVQWRKGHGA